MKEISAIENKLKKPWLAGLLNLLFCGLGQFYCGRPKRGILLAVVLYPFIILFWYLFLIPLPTINIALPLVAFCFFFYLVVNDAVNLARKINDSQEPQSFTKWYFYILFIGITFFAQGIISTSIKYHFSEPYKIPSKSMEPSIVKGDHIMVEKWFSKREGFHRGDIIIFPFPKDETRAFVKRVVGLPREKLKIENQKIFINGQALDESYAFHSEPVKNEPIYLRDNLDQIVIPEGMLFVLGDNRENSRDSRYFGFIEVSKVMGKVKMLYWSYDNKESQVRWNRIGKLVS